MLQLIAWVFNILRTPLIIQGYQTSIFSIIIYLMILGIVIGAINKLFRD